MPLKTKDSKLNLRSYTEILGQGDVAFAVKTDGLRFEFVDGGISSTGRWFLSRQKKFNKVIVYHSGQNGNIYIGDFDYWSVDSEDTEKYHIHFKNSRLAGNATVSWTQFMHGRNPGYSRIYLDNSNFLSTPPPGKKTPCKVTQTVQVYERDEQVKNWVLLNANGECESCTKKPFNTHDGEPYLEVHHLKHLADEGSDTTTNTVALCADCHRELHYGENRQAKLDALYQTISRLIRE